MLKASVISLTALSLCHVSLSRSLRWSLHHVSNITPSPLLLLGNCEQTLNHHSEALLHLPLSGWIHSNDKHCLISGSSHSLNGQCVGMMAGIWLVDLHLFFKKKQAWLCLYVAIYLIQCSFLQWHFLRIRQILYSLWVQEHQDLSSCDHRWDNHCFLEAVPAASPVLSYHVMGYIG